MEFDTIESCDILRQTVFAAIQKKLDDIRSKIREKLTIYSQRYREGNDFLDLMLRQYAETRSEFESYKMAEESNDGNVETMKTTVLETLWEYAEVRAVVGRLFKEQVKVRRHRNHLKKQFQKYRKN